MIEEERFGRLDAGRGTTLLRLLSFFEVGSPVWTSWTMPSPLRPAVLSRLLSTSSKAASIARPCSNRKEGIRAFVLNELVVADRGGETSSSASADELLSALEEGRALVLLAGADDDAGAGTGATRRYCCWWWDGGGVSGSASMTCTHEGTGVELLRSSRSSSTTSDSLGLADALPCRFGGPEGSRTRPLTFHILDRLGELSGEEGDEDRLVASE